MKKSLWTLAAVVGCATNLMVLTSCTDHIDNAVAEPADYAQLAEATILWYGAGGGNTDAGIMTDFHQFYSAKPESFERVNIVAQYKVSLKPANYQGKTNEEMAQEAEKLAEGKTEQELEAMGFARALKNADVRMEAIVPYLCLMNNMEFLYEVKDLTDYVACSTYTMWGTIGAMQSLPDHQAAGQDTKTALAHFVDDNVDSWDHHLYNPANPEEPNYYDMTLTDTRRLDDLAPVLRDMTDRLVGWSRWLLINEEAPPAWSPSSFYFQLPEDDMSGIPNL